jgi:hypothetical protein
MKTVRGTLLVLCGVLLSTVAVRAARLTLFIDGDNRTAYDASRGKLGRAEWTAAVTARKGTILTAVATSKSCAATHAMDPTIRQRRPGSLLFSPIAST